MEKLNSSISIKIIVTAVLLSLFAFNNRTQAQDVADTTISCFAIGPNAAYQVVDGDMAERFGNNFSIGGNVFYKTKKNWVFGFDMNYIFSDNVKETYVIDKISTVKGQIIDEEGVYGDYHIFERGMFASARIGKVLNVLSPNPNSGVLLMGGIGFLQHKIDFQDFERSTPQIRDEYEKGYDRLTNGIAFSEFIGYWYMSESRLVNVYAGFEFTQASTENRRSFDFYEMKKLEGQRSDFLYSFRFGWIIPLKPRQPDKFYYN